MLIATKDTGAYLNELANAEKALFDPFGVVTAADGVRQGNAGDAVIGILSSITRVRGLTSTIGKSAGLSRLAEEAGRSVQKSLDNLVGQLAKGNINPGIGSKHLFGDISMHEPEMVKTSTSLCTPGLTAIFMCGRWARRAAKRKRKNKSGLRLLAQPAFD